MVTETAPTITLPRPNARGELSVEEALEARRSIRHFTGQPVPLQAIGQLFWAAQGETSSDGDRTAPSAGGLLPLETQLVAGNVVGLDPGLYRYHPREHAISLQIAGDLRDRLRNAARWQAWVGEAAAVLVISAVYSRTAAKYGSRAERYVHMEVGHVSQNVYLQAQSLALGTVIVGSFEDDEVHGVLELPPNEAPLALMPLGYRRRR